MLGARVGDEPAAGREPLRRQGTQALDWARRAQEEVAALTRGLLKSRLQREALHMPHARLLHEGLRLFLY